MDELYIKAETWQLDDIRQLLSGEEHVTTNSYCFRPGSYVIKHRQDPEKLRDNLLKLAVDIPLQ